MSQNFKLLFSVVRSHPIKFVLNILFFILLMGIGQNYKLIEKKFTSFSPETPKISFVTDLLGKEQTIMNKLVVLPGVKKVVPANKTNLKDRINYFFKNSEVKELIDDQKIAYQKFDVYFQENSSQKTIQLIKAYITKILSKNEVVFSKVKGLSKPGMEKKKRSDFLTLFYIIFTLLFFVWLIFYFRMNMGVRKVGYLYQRFQRGKYIAFFTSLMMSVLMIALSLGVIYSVSSINSWFVFIAMSSVSIIFAVLLQIKEYRWK